MTGDEAIAANWLAHVEGSYELVGLGRDENNVVFYVMSKDTGSYYRQTCYPLQSTTNNFTDPTYLCSGDTMPSARIVRGKSGP